MEDQENGSAEPQFEDITLSVTTDGRRYDICFADFSAEDEMLFKDVTKGYDLMDVFASGAINATTLAGLVWLKRRRYEHKLNFQRVARKFTYGDMATVDISNGKEPEEESAPEA